MVLQRGSLARRLVANGGIERLRKQGQITEALHQPVAPRDPADGGVILDGVVKSGDDLFRRGFAAVRHRPICGPPLRHHMLDSKRGRERGGLVILGALDDFDLLQHRPGTAGLQDDIGLGIEPFSLELIVTGEGGRSRISARAGRRRIPRAPALLVEMRDRRQEELIIVFRWSDRDTRLRVEEYR